MKTVCISGYFTILHLGHIRYIRDAKKLGDKLIVIINNDEQVFNKKGLIVMNEEHRKEILENIKGVDEVVISIDTDSSVCKTLEMIKPDIFANGGDRFEDNIPEVKTCKDNNIKMIFNVGEGGKLDSSTRLLESYLPPLEE